MKERLLDKVDTHNAVIALIKYYRDPMIRGKRATDKKWIYGYYFNKVDGVVYLGDEVIESGSQGLLTRVRDSNNHWIFSRDIAVIPNTGDKVEVLARVYKGVLVKSMSTGKEYTIPLDEMELTTVISNTHDSTVVNNIYEFCEEQELSLAYVARILGGY